MYFLVEKMLRLDSQIHFRGFRGWGVGGKQEKKDGNGWTEERGVIRTGILTIPKTSQAMIV